MPKVELLVGITGSGKSAYALQRARRGALVINRDDLARALLGEYRHAPRLAGVYEEVEGLVFRAAVARPGGVVIDGTFLTPKARGPWVASAILQGAGLTAVTFPRDPSPSTHAMRRYRVDPQGKRYDEWLRRAGEQWALHHATPFDWKAEGFVGCMEARLTSEGWKLQRVGQLAA